MRSYLATLCILAGACSDAGIKTFNADPEAQITSPEDGEILIEGETEIIRGQIGDSNDSIDSLSVTWVIDGEEVCTDSEPSELGSVTCEHAFALDGGEILLEVRDPDGAGASDKINADIRPAGDTPDPDPDPESNTDPTCTITAPGDGEASEEGVEVRFEGLANDADTDDTLTAEWTSDVDGLLREGTPDSDGSTAFAISDLSVSTHRISLTVTDNNEASCTDSIFFTVNSSDPVNTPPTTPVVSIDPDPAYTLDPLVAVHGDSEDTDGPDALTYRYVWLDDGVEDATVTDGVYPAERTLKHHTYTVQVYAYDGEDESEPGTAERTVNNSAPTCTAAPTVTPDIAWRGATVTCTGASSSDADGDSITTTYSWPDGSTGPEFTIPADAMPDDTFNCTATFDDGDGGIGTCEATVTARNSIPEVLSVTLTPETVYTNDTVTAVVTASDADGDDLTYRYIFTVDEGEVQDGPMPTLDGTIHFDKWQTVEVSVTVSDAIDTSEAATDSLVVLNSPPEAPTVSILTVDELRCPDGWTATSDGVRCVKAFASPAHTWTDAEDACIAEGGDLVSILNTADNDLVFDLASGFDSQSVWIGFNDIDVEDSWTWSSGDPVSYTNWEPGEPNGGPDENCAEFYHDGAASHIHGIWNDLDCTFTGHTGGYVCQQEATVADFDCPPDGWTLAAAGDRCFKPFPELASWNSASATCASYGGNLVTLNSAEEQAEVAALFRAAEDGDPDYFMIGYTDRDEEDTWTWTSGSDSTYTHWGVGEPNDCCGGQDCAMVTNHPDGYWDDIHCDDVTEFGSVCELPADRSGLVCLIDEDSVDDDGDAVTYSIEWSWYSEDGPDGSEDLPISETDTTILPGDTVPGIHLDWGETWVCEVTPNDGEEDGEPGTASYEIGCPLGEDVECPALDCLDLLDSRPDAESGVYWIQPISDVYPVYCNMESDGGGWTLVMKAVDSNFLYSDGVWTTEALHDETDLDVTLAGEAKYQSFNEVPFDEILTSDPDDFSIFHSEAFDETWESSLIFYSSPGVILDAESYLPYFHDRTDPYFGSWGCSEYDRYGFNLYDSLGCVYIAAGMGCDHNGGARWGNRVNGWYEGGGNLTGHGWANYSCSASTMPGVDTGTGTIYVSAIRELMWVR